MSLSKDNTTKTLLDNALFTQSFEFVTPVPADLCAERLGELPFTDGNSSYTVEIEPIGHDYAFTLWVGNKHQNEPSKARVLGSGWITSQGNKTVVKGEVKIGLNRMLMLTIITIVMGFWMLGMFTSPLWLMYLFYSGGLPIVAPLYLFWQTLKERNKMVNNIQSSVTPYMSDRHSRLGDRQQDSSQEAYHNAQQSSRRQK